MSHIAIIGAGITGVTTAYALARRGYRVTVLERHRYAAMETSFANGGQLSASNAEVWNSRSTVLKGLRWMFSRDAPLLMNPRPSWHKYSWIGEFLRQIPNYRSNTIETVRLAIAAREHMFSIAEREHIDFDLERRGILHFYATRKEFDAATKVNALLREGGLDRRPVSPDEIRAIEPALHGQFHGGFFTESDSTGDIHKFTRGLAEACVRLGVEFRYDTSVQSISEAAEGELRVAFARENQTDTESFDRVVICAGVGSRALAAYVGDHVNVYPVKGYSITVCLDLNRDIRSDRIQPLVNWTRTHFPGMSTARVIPWAGLRPMLPGMLPKVGSGRRRNIFYNTGHGHLGWTLSAATAEAVAELVASSMPNLMSVKPARKRTGLPVNV